MRFWHPLVFWRGRALRRRLAASTVPQSRQISAIRAICEQGRQALRRASDGRCAAQSASDARSARAQTQAVAPAHVPPLIDASFPLWVICQADLLCQSDVKGMVPSLPPSCIFGPLQVSVLCACGPCLAGVADHGPIHGSDDASAAQQMPHEVSPQVEVPAATHCLSQAANVSRASSFHGSGRAMAQCAVFEHAQGCRKSLPCGTRTHTRRHGCVEQEKETSHAQFTCKAQVNSKLVCHRYYNLNLVRVS